MSAAVSGVGAEQSRLNAEMPVSEIATQALHIFFFFHFVDIFVDLRKATLNYNLQELFSVAWMCYFLFVESYL